MKSINIRKYNILYSIFLALLMLATLKVAGQSIKTIGIQSNFTSPFGQQNKYSRIQVIRPDTTC